MPNVVEIGEGTMAENLTPRVGDRVLVKHPEADDITRIGNVTYAYEGEYGGRFAVQLDGYAGEVAYHQDYLTVVDREPVEWPRYPMWRYGDYSYAENRRITSGIWGVKESVGGSTTVTNEAASAISADDARKVGEAWLKIAEHWDELTR